METMEMTTAAAAAGKPGYKLTRFGWIPQEWEVTKLKKCCQLIKDGTHFSPVSKDGPRMYITSKNIRNGHLDLQKLSFISEAEHRSIYSRCPVKKGDILLTKDGASTGNVCQNPLEEEFSLLSSVAVIRADEKKAYNSYLLQFLLSPIGVKAIDDEIAGQAITRITLDKIQAIQLPLPSLEEQKRVTNFLDEVDRSVRLLTELVEAKKAYKSGLMQQLLTGQQRFPEFQGQPWREVKLGNILREISRDIVWDDDELYDLVSVRRRSGGLYFRESLQGHQILTKTLKDVHAGDFLISRMQVVHGALGLASKEHEGMKVSGSYISLVSKNEDELLIEFFNYLSHLPQLYKIALLASHGVHIEKMTFNLRDYFKHSVLIPPSVQEQRKIVQTIEALNQEIELLQAQLRQWQQQKKGLMQQLLTGQLRVPHA